VACNKKQTDLVVNKDKQSSEYKEYLIPKGQHYAEGNTFQFVNKKEMHFLARFDSTCIYTTENPENITDINKLYGFSDCSSPHQQNSARLGWLWNGKAIELYAYCYDDSIRNNKLLGTLTIGNVADLTISVQPHQYVFEYDGKKTIMDRHCVSDSIQGYQLYPYFGGDETAPHDVHVFIKDL
jgi:hypothetical protein